MNHQYDQITVVGAGAAGLACAIAIAREGIDTVLVGTPRAPRDGRTIALLGGSTRFLEAIGAWPTLSPHAEPMLEMRIIDDTGSLFRAPPLSFTAGEIGLDAFGHNIENAALVEGLAAVAEAEPHLRILPTLLERATATPSGLELTLADGTRLAPVLTVGADGRGSPVRQAAGITARNWSYPQAAITGIFRHTRAHGGASTEFHTRHGPFTLVPLAGKRSSLVWVCAPEQAARLASLPASELARTVERQARSLLGAMELDGPCGVVPMGGLSVARFTALGVALIGEAAHVFPPIGAQGLNLGLRDGAALRDAVVDARSKQPAFEALHTHRAWETGTAAPHAPDSWANLPAALSAYDRGRRLDTRVRTNAIDILNRTLLADMLPADLLRGAGMLALALPGPLRRLVMREGLAPSHASPRLMQVN